MEARKAAPRLVMYDPVPWEVIAPFVQRFNRAPTLTEKRKILSQLQKAIYAWRKAEEQRKEEERRKKEEEEKRKRERGK